MPVAQRILTLQAFGLQRAVLRGSQMRSDRSVTASPSIPLPLRAQSPAS